MKRKISKSKISIAILVAFTLWTSVVYFIDKQNKVDVISVKVDATNKSNDVDEMVKKTIYVYNQTSKVTEPQEMSVLKQKNLIEGDYINEIIKRSPFVTKDMKFQSAYLLNDSGNSNLIIRLSSEFKTLSTNIELYNGFKQSVIATMKENYKNLQNVDIQIDGDIIIQ